MSKPTKEKPKYIGISDAEKPMRVYFGNDMIDVVLPNYDFISCTHSKDDNSLTFDFKSHTIEVQSNRPDVLFDLVRIDRLSGISQVSEKDRNQEGCYATKVTILPKMEETDETN